VAGIVDEKIIVVRNVQQAETYRRIMPDIDNLVVDSFSPNSALAGMMTGLSYATGKYSVVLPCDSPLVSPELVDYLFEQSVGSDAAVPRWPYGYVEPLHSVYRVSSSLENGKRVLAEGKYDFRSLIETLGSVLYVPIESLGSLAPGLKTFFNINSPEDLEEARRMIKVENLGEQASGDNRH
jgi:molybdopterin-guanine dinucleotide biosynthesis protein A